MYLDNNIRNGLNKLYNLYNFLLSLQRMKVNILRVIDNQNVSAEIVKPQASLILPSITDGWRFNFKKHSKNLGYQTYVLVTKENQSSIEGCLTFLLKGKVEPYMAFVEIAPHNKGTNKKYDHIAACLSAYACRLSVIIGKGDFKGWLAFDVMEENKDDEIKLMAVYSKKYGALRFGQTTMVISPETGEKLITKFLN